MDEDNFLEHELGRSSAESKVDRYHLKENKKLFQQWKQDRKQFIEKRPNIYNSLTDSEKVGKRR